MSNRKYIKCPECEGTIFSIIEIPECDNCKFKTDWYCDKLGGDIDDLAELDRLELVCDNIKNRSDGCYIIACNTCGRMALQTYPA